MKKTVFLAAAAVMLGLPSLSQAQTVTADVTASARVQASLTAATTNQLNFGTLAMGASSTLASSGGSQAALSGTGTAGLGQIHVQHNTAVNVTATVPSVLTRAGGGTLAFAATCSRSATSGGSGTDAGNCSTQFGLAASAPGTVQSTYILVGGTVTGSAGAGIGDFTGTLAFTFTATN